MRQEIEAAAKSVMKIEERLALNKFAVDSQAHIALKEEVCASCRERPCLTICPAECFKLRDGKVAFSYEGCLECGSCRTVCRKGALEWGYPRGGFGVSYEYG